MSTISFFFVFIPILALILLLINMAFAPHNPYQEKDSPFECGYHSFLGQNRTQFNIAFFVYGLCFLVFDLEILLVYPYAVSAYNNNFYGLFVVIVFVALLTIGLIYELGKGVLNISSRQDGLSLVSSAPVLVPQGMGMGMEIKKLSYFFYYRIGQFFYYISISPLAGIFMGFLYFMFYSLYMGQIVYMAGPENHPFTNAEIVIDPGTGPDPDSLSEVHY